MHWSLGFILVVLTFGSDYIIASYQDTHVDVIVDTRLDSTVLHTVAVRSAIECQVMCINTLECYAVNYAHNKTCYLMSGDDGAVIPDAAFWLIHPPCLQVGQVKGAVNTCVLCLKTPDFGGLW